MSLQKQIDQDIKEAMKAKRKDELLALRSIKSMLLLAKTEKGANQEISEEDELKILMKAVKQRTDSAALFAEQNRQDLAEKENVEKEVISKYLPKALSPEALKEAIEKIIKSVSATNMKDFGKVMKQASSELAGQADGKTISQIVKELLSA